MPTINSSFSVSSVPIHRSSTSGFITSSDSSDTTTISSPRSCYLTAQAKINNIPGVVLLDTGSGVTVISSRHYSVLGSVDSIQPYDDPPVQGPNGSSIGPIGRVVVDITMASVTVQQPAILALAPTLNK